jgi:hypothetical protein
VAAGAKAGDGPGTPGATDPLPVGGTSDGGVGSVFAAAGGGVNAEGVAWGSSSSGRR